MFCGAGMSQVLTPLIAVIGENVPGGSGQQAHVAGCLLLGYTSLYSRLENGAPTPDSCIETATGETSAVHPMLSLHWRAFL